MAEKIIRKPRHKINTKNMDLLKPIDLTIFGGENDPCFSKHFDPKADACQRCGDSELCSIAMSQRAHLLRQREEAGMILRDLHEPKMTYHQYAESKLEANTKIDLIETCKGIRKDVLNKEKISLERIEEDLRAQIKRHSTLKIVKIGETRYIKTI